MSLIVTCGLTPLYYINYIFYTNKPYYHTGGITMTRYTFYIVVYILKEFIAVSLYKGYDDAGTYYAKPAK